MIVVEGPDGAGKSTLVAELCSRLGLEQGVRRTADRDRLYETTVVDSYDAVLEAVRGTRPPKVWDRMFFSDPIYAHIIRDEESRFADPQFQYLYDLVCAMRCPVIICLPPLEVVRENVMNGGHQLDGVVEHIDSIYEAYEELAGMIPGRQRILYDYTMRGTIPRICTRLRQYIHHRKERQL